MKLEVVNVRAYPLRHPLPYVYVGRLGRRRWAKFLRQHPLANPFTIEDAPGRTEADRRDACLARYVGWLDALETRDALLSLLASEIVLLRLPRLGCWCAPKKCHADILVQRVRPIVDRILSVDSGQLSMAEETSWAK